MLNLLGAGHGEALKKTEADCKIQQHMALVVVGQKWRREGTLLIFACVFEKLPQTLAGQPAWKKKDYTKGHRIFFCKILLVKQILFPRNFFHAFLYVQDDLKCK